MDIKKVIAKVKTHHPTAKLGLIREAYDFAKKAHGPQKRASGQPYIEHPLNTAYILADLGFDEQIVIAGLMHDLIEDTEVTIKDIKKKFGADVANLVDGVTKIRMIRKKSKTDYQAETLRKILVATSKDIRVIFIKLADKLHNMRTLRYLPEDKRVRIAKDTLEVYAPLAYRLGLMSVKSELEDLAMRWVYPNHYRELKKKIPEAMSKRKKRIEYIQSKIKKLLDENNIKGTVKGRPKHFYSIHKKMVDYDKSFEEIFDIMAYRIITKTKEDCYTLLGLIHNMWKPMPGRFKDYIAIPKANMYQSLHTTVIGDDGNPIEIQIRTKEMDLIAEGGIAAHWAYKGIVTDKHFDKKLSWLKEILDWQKEAKEAKDFVENLKVDFFKDKIFCFTPMGDVIELPKGATPIDFAYAVHTDVGSKCSGARVNRGFVSLRHQLKNGDVVEIITSRTHRPSRTWLKIATTAKALSKIRKAIHEDKKIRFRKPREKITSKEAERAALIEVKNVKHPEIKLAKCCNPLPGDGVVGYVTKGGIVSVHTLDCGRIAALDAGPKTKVKTEWRIHASGDVNLELRGIDRVGLLADILNTLSRISTNLTSVKAKLESGNIFVCNFNVNVDDLAHLRDIIRRIKRIQGIRQVIIGGVES